jgi:hypothetical protein
MVKKEDGTNMRGCKKIIALAILLLLFIASVAVSAQNDTNACEGAAPEDEMADQTSLPLVQEASSGTLIKNSDGNYTLTLNNVTPYTMYHTNLSESSAGSTPMERFIAGFNWNNPTAALTLADADVNEDTIILALTSPSYDNQTKTLTYAARIIENPRDDRLSYQISRADARIPERFGQATIAISGCPNSYWKCCTSEEDQCGTLNDISCCWNSKRIACEACARDCYHQAKCREEYGGKCGDSFTGSCGDWCGPW